MLKKCLFFAFERKILYFRLDAPFSIAIFCILTNFLILYFFVFQGTLKGFDQTINIILDDSHERVYSPNQGVEQIILGLHLIRGDNV